MATTIWKGHIVFGLVAFPVRLQAAARSHAVSLAVLQIANDERSPKSQRASIHAAMP
jgi:non-homologous end joining protein Ku